MIIPNKKTASLILSRMDGEKSETVDKKEDVSELHLIAGDIIDAVKEGSSEDLVAAMKAFVAACDYEE